MFYKCERFRSGKTAFLRVNNFVIIDRTNLAGTTRLSLPIRIPDEEKKLNKIFIFTFLCGASEGFMKALKAFIKPFEAPQRSVKIEI